MATTVGNFGDYSFMRDNADKKTARKGDGVFARLFATFVASREAWARDAVEGHLSTFTDAELVKLGLDDERIAQVRSNLRARQSNWL